MDEVAAGLEVVLEGAQRAGGGVGEAVGEVVGEARAESLVGDKGEAVVGVAGESVKSGVGIRQAVAWRTAAAC